MKILAPHKLRPEHWFLLLFIPLSLLMMIALPIFRAPDEQVHLEQIYTLATGQWVSSMQTHQALLPEQLCQIENAQSITHKQVMQMLQSTTPDNMVVSPVNSASAIYPPLSYLPQVLGMKLMMLLSNNQVLFWYGARLGNWICVVLLLYFAIRLIPCCKYIMLAFTLLPLNLQQMISASADGITTALVYLQIAFLLHSIYRKPLFRLREHLLLLLLCIGLASWKICYYPFALLLLLIPQQCFISRHSRALSIGTSLLIPVLMTILWGCVCYTSLFMNPIDGSTAQTMHGLGALLQNPFSFFQRLLASLTTSGPAYIARIFCYSNSLSWFNVDAGFILPTISVFLTISIFLVDNSCPLDLRSRSMLIITSIICTLLIFLMLHVWFTPVDHYRIEGFQARYLLPLLTPVSAAVHPGKKRISLKLLPWLTAGSVFVSLSIICIVFRSTLA